MVALTNSMNRTTTEDSKFIDHFAKRCDHRRKLSKEAEKLAEAEAQGKQLIWIKATGTDIEPEATASLDPPEQEGEEVEMDETDGKGGKRTPRGGADTARP